MYVIEGRGGGNHLLSRPFFLLTLLLSTIFWSCSEDPVLEPLTDSSKLAGEIFQTLSKAREQSVWFNGVNHSGDGVFIYLSDGTSLDIPKAAFEIYSEEPVVELSDAGIWMVEGLNTGIRKRSNTFDPEKRPVCGWITSEVLTIFLDTGEIFVMAAGPENLLPCFRIRKAMNPLIADDGITVREGKVFKVSVKGFVQESLVPEFTTAGKGVLFNGTILKSGLSKVPGFGEFEIVVRGFDDKDYPFKIIINLEQPSFPCVRITTTDGKIINSRTEYVEGTVRFEDPDRIFSDTEVLELPMKIRGRGNSTWNLEKKPYKIKLSEKKNVFGMPANKDWALLANHFDKTLMRNAVAMRISEVCGMPWTPKFRTVEVFLNGDYIGSYDLFQHKEVAKEKVNIDITAGDVYLELDETMDATEYFYSSVYKVPITFKNPEAPDEQTIEFVKDKINSFERALSSTVFSDTEKGWKAFMDEESLINYYIVQELTKNIDGNLRRSSFLTLGPGKKLCFYHVWDFDLAFGNSNRISLEFPGATNTFEGWYIKDFGRLGKGTGWFPRIFEDPSFVSSLKTRWKEVAPELRDIPQFIDKVLMQNELSYSHNFERWNIIGKRLGPNVKVFPTYQGEVDYLKDFYSSRFSWLDKNIEEL